MPRFGVQAATFASSWDLSAARRAVVAAEHLGFDALEIPLHRSGPFDFSAVRAAAQTSGVEIVCRTALPRGCSALTQAERVRALLGQAVQGAAALGATSLSGAFLLAPGDYDATVSPGAAALLVELLADLTHEAAARGVSLALEPAHQFESPVINTVAQAAAIVRAVGADNLGLGLSTLQMHIGEPSLRAAVRQAGPLLRSVRAEENSGGIPGSGAVRWDVLWQGLRELEFDGLIVLAAPRDAQEGDRPNTTSDAQMSRVRPETDLYPEEYAAEGLAFLKAGVLANGAPQSNAEYVDSMVGGRRYSSSQNTHAAGADDADPNDLPGAPAADLPEAPEKPGGARPALAKPGTKSYRNRW